VIVIGAAAAAVAIAGGGFALSQHSSPSSAPAGQTAQPASGPIRLESITPSAGSKQVDGANPIVVSFSAPVAANSPDPTVQPAVAGTWNAEGNDLVFTPSAAFKPASHITVSVPAGPGGVRGANGGLLTNAATDHFSTGAYSSLRLAELLGQLGYLPLTWAADESGADRQQYSSDDGAAESQAGEAYDPPAGTFSWKPGYPAELRSAWNPTGASTVLRGAVMAFQSEHGLAINGHVNAKLWKAVFQAAQGGERNANGYTYAIASKSVPETLTIWHDGQIVMRSLANTGIPVSPTVDGTFPVYLRYRFQIMSGTNPDGSAYADPVSFVSYFNGGDAVHYFPRGSYGFQQSLGCVELPYNSAEHAYPYLTYGSLVTVTG
jgi:peptidoglycan hydrolase-like protein with peptidoglycan-binding domain